MSDYNVGLPSGNTLTRMENGIFLLSNGDVTRPISKDVGELFLIEVIEHQRKLLKKN